MSDDLKSLWKQVDAAMSPTNARAFDGNDNYEKVLDIKTCVVGDDADGTPAFVFDAQIPRSAVNDLGLSVNWHTEARAEAAAFLRALADKIEKGT